MMGPAMRGMKDLTRESGPTYRAPRGEEEGSGPPPAGEEKREGSGDEQERIWARIDSWWGSGEIKACWEPEVTSAKTGFTRHSGVGVVVRMYDKEEEGSTAQERTIARLPEEGRGQQESGGPPRGSLDGTGDEGDEGSNAGVRAHVQGAAGGGGGRRAADRRGANEGGEGGRAGEEMGANRQLVGERGDAI